MICDMKAEISDASTVGLLHNLRMNKDPCVVWSTSPDGKSEPLCTIARDDCYKTYIRAAETFYDVTTAGRSALSFEINHTAGLGPVPAWRDISAGITEAFLAKLTERGVGREVLALVRSNLDIESSITRFSNLASEKFGDSPMHAEITSAHEVASVAHAKDSYARPQDRDGLFHIPYMQHPRNMAIHGLELSLAGRTISTILLHDVVEDGRQPQEVTLAGLQRSFDKGVTDGVMQLTKLPSQTRAEFLDHIGQLTGELAVAKGLDRFDNLIRAFGLQDPKYHSKVLDECAKIYDPIFAREPLLKSFSRTYSLLKQELAQYRDRLSQE